MDTRLIIALEFFKTGLFSVGGGLATIPFLQEMGSKYGWFSQSTFSTMLAVSESTPGPIGVNIATYTGFTTYGILGGILATLCLILPSIITVTIISRSLPRFQENNLVQKAFAGLKPAVVGILLSACMPIFVMTLLNYSPVSQSFNFYEFFNIKNIGLFILIFIIYKKLKLHPIAIILICGILGVVLKL